MLTALLNGMPLSHYHFLLEYNQHLCTLLSRSKQNLLSIPLIDNVLINQSEERETGPAKHSG